MHSHTNQIAHVTYGDLSYVKFEENPFKDERALNHTRTRTRTLAHALMHAVIKHDQYVSHVTCGHL
jgi:hypothetical protein